MRAWRRRILWNITNTYQLGSIKAICFERPFNGKGRINQFDTNTETLRSEYGKVRNA